MALKNDVDLEPAESTKQARSRKASVDEQDSAAKPRRLKFTPQTKQEEDPSESEAEDDASSSGQHGDSEEEDADIFQGPFKGPGKPKGKQIQQEPILKTPPSKVKKFDPEEPSAGQTQADASADKRDILALLTDGLMSTICEDFTRPLVENTMSLTHTCTDA